jgi:hypothetical protein
MRIEQYSAILTQLSLVAGGSDHIARRRVQNLLRIESNGAIFASLGLVARGADHSFCSFFFFPQGQSIISELFGAAIAKGKISSP